MTSHEQPGQINDWGRQERFDIHSKVFEFLKAAEGIDGGRESLLGKSLDTLSRWIWTQINMPNFETKTEFMAMLVPVKEEALRFSKTGDTLSKLWKLSLNIVSEIERWEKAS
jgi:hypothetical protein